MCVGVVARISQSCNFDAVRLVLLIETGEANQRCGKRSGRLSRCDKRIHRLDVCLLSAVTLVRVYGTRLAPLF